MKLPYWLKGSITGAILVTIPFLLSLIMTAKYVNGPPSKAIVLLVLALYVVSSLPSQVVGLVTVLIITKVPGGTTFIESLHLQSGSMFSTPTLNRWIFEYILMGAVGALIGWLYGKIKGKQPPKVPPLSSSLY